MSQYKDGEGVTRFKPIYFKSPHLVEGRNFEVVLVGDHTILLSERGCLDKTQDDLDVRIVPWATHGQFCLTIPDGLFLTYYVQTFDLIVRVNGLTVHFDANLQLEEELTDE